MTPNFKLLANDKDITHTINLNASKIEFRDEAGTVSDEITLSIEGHFKKPKYEDELKLWLGTVELGLFFCGVFKVQTSKYKDGSKKGMEITATAADFSKGLKIKRSESFERVSIQKVAEIIAIRHGLEIRSDFDDIYIIHLEQTNESDLNFLKRMADEYNALFAIKNNRVIFKKKIEGGKKSENLPRFDLVNDENTSIYIENSNKTLYTACKAVWRDTKENVQKSITVGSGDTVKTIKDSFESEADAKIKAEAALQKANAGIKSGDIVCAGFEVYAGGILNLTGTHEDDGEYDIQKAHHIMNDDGWNITLELEN